MKSKKLNSMFALAAILCLLAQPCVFAGENPWDGDNNPAGSSGVGSGGGGGSNGSGGSSSGNQAMRDIVIQLNPGGSIQTFISTIVYHLVVKGSRSSISQNSQITGQMSKVSAPITTGDCRQSSAESGSSR